MVLCVRDFASSYRLSRPTSKTATISRWSNFWRGIASIVLGCVPRPRGRWVVANSIVHHVHFTRFAHARGCPAHGVVQLTKWRSLKSGSYDSSMARLSVIRVHDPVPHPTASLFAMHPRSSRPAPTNQPLALSVLHPGSYGSWARDFHKTTERIPRAF